MNSVPLSIIISVVAGGCAFLFVLNRYLIGVKDVGHKFPLVWVSFVVALLCSALFGYAASGSTWMLIPVIVLIVTLLGEVRRAVLRRRYRGEPPVEQENTGISL